MKKIIFGLSIVALIILFLYLSMDKNKITVQEKMKNDNYTYIAYKEKIEDKKARTIKDLLHHGNWVKSDIDVKETPSDFIFLFNYERQKGVIPTYQVWVTSDPREVTLLNGDEEMKLKGQKAKRMLEGILSIKF